MNFRKTNILIVIFALMVFVFSGCGADGKRVLKGTYVSETEDTMLVCDKELIYIMQGDDIGVSEYSIEGEVLILGDDTFSFAESGDDNIQIGDEIFEKTSTPLSVRWSLIKWASKYRISSAKLGIIQWMILDPIFMEGSNSLGKYAMVGSWMAFIGLIIGLIIIGIIVAVIVKKIKK